MCTDVPISSFIQGILVIINDAVIYYVHTTFLLFVVNKFLVLNNMLTLVGVQEHFLLIQLLDFF